MNNDNNRFVRNNAIFIDEEQLRVFVGMIKQYAVELNSIKQKNDLIWEQCGKYLGESITSNINIAREYNSKRFKTAIDELDNYANKIESISNIWKDTEIEIKSSSKSLESMFADIERFVKSTIYQDYK